MCTKDFDKNGVELSTPFQTSCGSCTSEEIASRMMDTKPIELTEEEFEKLTSIIRDPPEPTQALVELMRKHPSPLDSKSPEAEEPLP